MGAMAVMIVMQRVGCKLVLTHFIQLDQELHGVVEQANRSHHRFVLSSIIVIDR